MKIPRKLTDEQIALLTEHERHQYRSPRADSDLIAALETIAQLRMDLARARDREMTSHSYECVKYFTREEWAGTVAGMEGVPWSCSCGFEAPEIKTSPVVGIMSLTGDTYCSECQRSDPTEGEPITKAMAEAADMSCLQCGEKLGGG